MQSDFKNIYIKRNGFIGTLIKNPSLKQSQSIWEEISHDSDNIFLSWLWIGNWLKMIKKDFNANLFIIKKNNKLIAAVFLVMDKESRYKLITSRQIFINEICSENYNMVIEYNKIAIKSGYEKQSYEIFSEFLKSNDNWDELVINAMEKQHFVFLKDAFNHDYEIVNESNTRQAYLNDTGFKTTECLKQSILSSNKRSQINRSKKHIENLYGNLELTPAKDLTEALNYFDELGKLHTKYWQSKNLDGAFANNNWVDFNKNIITQGFDKHQVDILKIKSGDFTIGYLYNLINNKHAFNIQSGFNYLDTNKFKPGFLSHWLAIEHYWNNGFELYDLLAGGEGYKKSLSNSEKELVWFKIKQPKLVFSIERNLKNIKHHLKEIKHNTVSF